MNTEFAANVKLLLVFDGENGSNTFTDYSFSNRTPEVNFGVEINTEDKKFGSGSGKARIGINKPSLKYSANTDFNLNGDWTIDFFLKVDSNRTLQNEYFMSISEDQYFRLSSTNPPVLHCTWLGSMGNSDTGVSGPLQTDQWYHFALVHNKNKEWTFYVNGSAKTRGIGNETI